MKNVIHKNVPFYDQITLSNWKLKGFALEKDAIFWHRKACGIACAQIVGEALTGEKTKIGELIVEAVNAGAYVTGKGWGHENLASFISKRFDLTAKAHREACASDIKKLIDKRNLVIASVGVGFRGMKSGHLIVILGYRTEKAKLTGFYVHHPSTNPEMCIKEGFIPIEVFENSFSGNIINVNKKTK